MLLRFCSDTGPRDLEVTVEDPDATVADLAEALEPDVAVGPLLVDGRLVAPSTPIDRAGIGDGTVVARAVQPGSDGPGHGSGPGWPVVSLVVISGSDAGQTFDLAPGTYQIGRASPEGSGPGPGPGPGPAVAIADPTVSTHHGSVSVAVDGRVTVTDQGSRNGTWIGGRSVTSPTLVKERDGFRCGAASIALRAATPSSPTNLAATLSPGTGRPRPHHRPPRVGVPRPAAPLQLPGPPEPAPPVSPVGVLAVVASLALGAVMVLVLGSWLYAIFALLGPVVMVANALDGRRRRRRRQRRGDRHRRKILATLETGLGVACRAEAADRAARFVGMAAAVGTVAGTGSTCWERRPDHPDAFEVRIGVGDTTWPIPVDPAVGTHPPDVAEVLHRHRILHEVAIGVRIQPGHPIAVVGQQSSTSAVARAMVVQAAVIHGPADLRVAVLAAEDRAARWHWCGWLPHRQSPTTGSLLATAADADRVADALTEPLPPADPTGPAAPARPTTLVVIDDPGALSARRSPARAVLRASGDVGLALAPIVLAEDLQQVPAACTTVVTVSDGGAMVCHGEGDRSGAARATVREDRDGTDGAGSDGAARPWPHQEVTDGSAPGPEAVMVGCSVAVAAGVGRALARLEDPEVDDVGLGLPDRIALAALLGGDRPSNARVLARWRAAGPDPDPLATLGMSAEGPLTVDLAVDGPHALVAGTTGAGKSELLRTLVAALATSSSPDHLSFVLIDFKGGSAFDACARLPHTVGVVTDLDAQLAARALRCLEAELHHRERRLREAGADDLSGLRRACPDGLPLARLVVVIDEFATLAAELPDFVESLVGIAQRGRSLGVHLVLATQRPSGSVSEHIRANAALRIALRVQSANDSTDVIETADAASIPRQRPGRALVRFGPGELVAVQTALASTPADLTGTRGPVRVRPLGLSGATDDGPTASREASAPSAQRTDLDELVDVIAGAWAEAGGAPPRRPWPDPLPSSLTWPVTAGPDGEDGDASDAGQDCGTGEDRGQVEDRGLAVGLVDQPDQQRQVPYRWDLDDGALLLVGLPGSGTSTTAATVALEVARRWSPDDAHLHVIDLGAGDLRALAGLAHVGAVIGADETERQRRLLADLAADLADRRSRRRHEVGGLARRFLVVDGLGAFTDRWDELHPSGTWDHLVELVARGGEVGIHVVLAAEGPTAATHRFVTRCPQRLVFRLGDRADYAPFAIAARDVPTMVPGRCIDARRNAVVQIARPPEGLGAAVARLAGRNRPAAVADDRRASPVAELPARISLPAACATGHRGGTSSGEHRPAGRSLADGGLELVVGISDQGLGPARLILAPGGHALVAGPPRSGRSTALATIAQSGREAGLRVVVVALRATDFAGDIVHPDALDPTLLADTSVPTLVVVDDADLTAEAHPALRALVAERYATRHVVAAGRSDRLRGLYGHWTRELRADRTGLLLVPDPDVDGELTGVRLPRTPPVAMVPGRAWLSGGDPEGFLQVAHPAATDPLGDAAPLADTGRTVDGP